ncbi:MAG: hypothetical protein L6Q29_01655 [Candidatus Pacebacteria bacterium]|nr:hypothetical protein [Candidatus Paceibacterota bacterium]NUQ57323.1 hypothetical protein [Candidatus Paceibacter sp.]
MIEIIPAINALSFEEAKNKIRLVEPYVKWAHLDVADGTFTKNTLWHNPAELDLLETSLNLEVHLMASEPEKRIMDWLKPNVRRIIFHVGASKDPDFVINLCQKNDVEAGVSISPDESEAKALARKDKVKFFQILGVHPGLPGQKTLEETFDRIKEVRKFCPSCIIEADGGMNKETIPKVVSAGANIIVAANAIFNSGKSINETIEELENL